ncbi:hypothetical protein, conserved [Trypanosoma brucei gambiense DAL972]|uniref:Amastin n=1 Tax=Trypanosoma brucei gambiense (strain MHOM/CI/86/DAL972) TaxID=679716 RepID=D0A842_TRYB9|nr:hypothetical protein, conserved [Trypanosoma brucei gambiense DAL972]CBH17843.1 hypothetical protein, conserved [Trypanosoma brucei gambiense DAL972]|eukprot:XP_011780107.1 hypothetical protein, conserved [Trypanosoma brucei gambiense DAL972]
MHGGANSAVASVHVDPTAQLQYNRQRGTEAYAECEYSDGSADENNRYPQRGQPPQTHETAAVSITDNRQQSNMTPRAHAGGTGGGGGGSTMRRNVINRFDYGIISPSDARSLFLGASLLNIFFAILGTSLSQLDEVGGACFTFWGYKTDCDSVSYTIRTQLLPCAPIRGRLQTGAAFSIISICLLASIIYLYIRSALAKYMSQYNAEGQTPARRMESRSGILPAEDSIVASNKWTIVAVGGVVVLCEVVSWAMTISVYVSRFCEDASLDRNKVYGPGFALLIVGTLLFLMALVVFALRA